MSSPLRPSAIAAKTLQTPDRITGKVYQKNKKSIRIDDIDKDDDDLMMTDEPYLDNGDKEVDEQINIGMSNIDESFVDSASTPPVKNQSMVSEKRISNNGVT